MTCLFCQVVNKEIPATVVFEDDELLVFKDINPQAPLHLLIIPKAHIATLNELSGAQQSLLGHMVLTATAIANTHETAKTGYRLVWNCLEDGGQAVYHIHLHLLAGRRLTWPPG